MFYFYVNKNVA